jgi:RNA polymerase sigma-54 factor
MTPQLMQAIKLLQLSNLDLTAHVEAELERNPLLERAGEDAAGRGPGGEDEPVGADAGAERATGQGAERHERRVDDVPRADVDAAPRSSADLLVGYSEWASTGPGGRDGAGRNLEAFLAAEMSLAEHLAAQLAVAVADPARRLIGQYLIDLVDEAGYLPPDLEAATEKLGASAGEVDAVLAILQSFDPCGVCARNLGECLAIQLRERNRFDPAMQALVGHLGLLARRELAELRRICGVSEEDLLDMIGEVRRLDPKPGLAFGSALVQPIVPDVLVRAGPDGAFIVELNSDTLPKVLVNQRYHAAIARRAKGERDRAYLADRLQSASWLVRALDQRAKTILKVATEIVRQQDGFLVHGVRHLRPLNLRTVADAIGMHESTVSRVTANKYMATSRGIFELKYFFTASIASSDGGEAHSAEAVRHRIRQLINDERPDSILSDDTIVDLLREAGIDIARRTVAKYREAQRIPSSVQRRREKQASLGAAC